MANTNRSTIQRLAAAITVLLLLGCGSSERPIYPVEGKVVYEDGSPVKSGSVEFSSDEAMQTQLTATGEIQSDGTFHLSTFAEHDGAVEGKHLVIIVPPISMSAERVEGVVHPRFSDYKTSGLQVTVKPEANQFTIKVTTP